MSFATTASGSSAAVKDAIRKQCDGYGTGISRDEFEAAIPAINAEIDRLALGTGDEKALITVDASGHASSIKITAKRNV